MKSRIPLMSFLILTAFLAGSDRSNATHRQQQTKAAPTPEVHFVSPLKGWVVTEETLQDYEVGVEGKVVHSGSASVFAKSKMGSNPPRAIVLRQSISADLYRGQRVRLSGWLCGKNVEDWAGLWLRIDGENGHRISMDNMKNRPFKGTADWRRYEMTLEVPENAVAISFGMVLAGKGQIWADDLKIEKAPADAPSTDIYGKSEPRPGDDEFNRRRATFARRLAEELKSGATQPVNLDFENPLI
jgi:hypothetical protein